MFYIQLTGQSHLSEIISNWAILYLYLLNLKSLFSDFLVSRAFAKLDFLKNKLQELLSLNAIAKG